MDVIRRLEETAVYEIIQPTIEAFVPLLNEEKADIEKVEREEFKYGQGDRHYLDVYYPPAASALSTPNEKLPVLFFIYGGGYNSGSRRYGPYENVYRGLGSFFAARGFLTVIPDYRLDPGYIFMMGHSAGAAHTFALYSYPPLRASLTEKAAEVGLKVRGVVLNGTPWHFNLTGSEKLFPVSGPNYLYLGDEAQQRERESRGLWAALGEDDVRAFPDVLLVQGECEPDWVKFEVKDVMEKEMREKFAAVGRELQETYIAGGHNHISVNLALSTGDEEGEKWGYDVVEWIKTKF